MKKIIFLTIILFNLTFVFGQVCVDSRTMYSNGGLNISYCTIFSGSQGNCKSYTVTISISNTDKDFISLAGSTIYLASNQGDFPPVGKCDRDTSNSNSSGDVRIVFPGQGLGFVTELKPSYNVRQSYVVYTNDTYPVVTYSITPNYMNIIKEVKVVPKISTGQSQNSSPPTNNNSTNNSNQITYQSLQAAVVEFNSLLPSVPEDNERDVLYNGVKSVLNSNSSSDDYKLKTVNDAIVRFKNKIIQQDNSNAINNQKATENTATAERQQQAQNAYNERIRQDQERQNREIANKRQQYSSAFSAGTTAYNSGNYTEAKTQFANAINLANSEQERTPAQNNYNKSNDVLNKQAKAKVIKDVVQTTLTGINAIVEASKANKIRKQQELQAYNDRKIAEKEQERIEAERIIQQNASKNDRINYDFQIALNFAKDNKKDGLQNAITIMLPYAIDDVISAAAVNTIGTWYFALDDYPNAKKWYIKAMKSGDLNATSNIAEMCLSGKGLIKDRGFASMYFQTACKKGKEDACKRLAETRTLLLKSLNATSEELFNLGTTYFLEEDYKQAKILYTRAYETASEKIWWKTLEIAKMCYAESQINDKVEAAKWYEITIKLFETDAEEKINIGTNNESDYDYAKNVYEYATCLKDIDGYDAIKNYEKSIRDNYNNGNFQIGIIYELGKGGVNPDWSLAKTFYEKAAENKSVTAMNYIGQLLEKGGPNLEQNTKESLKWFKMACKADKSYCK